MLDSEPIGNWSGKQELNNDVKGKMGDFRRHRVDLIAKELGSY